MKHHSLVTRYSYPSGLIGASHHIMGAIFSLFVTFWVGSGTLAIGWKGGIFS